MSELKKAHAALTREMKQKTKILGAEQMVETNSELESLFDVVKEKTEQKIEM